VRDYDAPAVVPRWFHQPKEIRMNKQQVRGATNQVTGSVKREVGKLTGDRSAAASGAARNVKGKLQKDVGDAKEAVRGDRELQQERQGTRRKSVR
jgi:uncharacterized protein YjbJ (UPF0337 family)